jgi:hypothetical protein
MSLKPSGEDRTLTRRELLALRAVEEARLREKWAEREDRKTSCNNPQ